MLTRFIHWRMAAITTSGRKQPLSGLPSSKEHVGDSVPRAVIVRDHKEWTCASEIAAIPAQSDCW